MTDPLLLVGVMAVALVAPVQIGTSISWVYSWVSGGSKLTHRLPAREVRLIGLTIWSIWLVLGLTGHLPAFLGGDVHIWSTVCGAGTRIWFIAIAVTLAAGTFAERVGAVLSEGESTGATYVSLMYILGELGLGFALAVMMLCAFLTFHVEPVAAAASVAILSVGLAAACPVVWFLGTQSVRPLALACALLLSLASVVGAAGLWPGTTNAVNPSGFLAGHGLNTLATELNSTIFVAAVMFPFSSDDGRGSPRLCRPAVKGARKKAKMVGLP